MNGIIHFETFLLTGILLNLTPTFLPYAKIEKESTATNPADGSPDFFTKEERISRYCVPKVLEYSRGKSIPL